MGMTKPSDSTNKRTKQKKETVAKGKATRKLTKKKEISRWARITKR